MRKLTRPPLLFPADLAPHVPDVWRQAGNEVLDQNPSGKEVVERILNDARLKKFWSGFDSLVSDAHNGNTLAAGTREQWLEFARRQILLILAARGGRRRKLTTAAIKKHRAKVAKAIDSVVELMFQEDDDHVRFIGVEDALYWARRATFDVEFVEAAKAKGIPLRHYFDDSNPQAGRLGPKLLTDVLAHRPPLIHVLRIVSRKLKRARPLGWSDDILHEPLVQPRRSERTHLEAVLVHQLSYLARPLPAALFAPAIEVALELPNGSIEVEELADRLRKIYKPSRRKSSGRRRKT